MDEFISTSTVMKCYLGMPRYAPAASGTESQRWLRALPLLFGRTSLNLLVPLLRLLSLRWLLVFLLCGPGLLLVIRFGLLLLLFGWLLVFLVSRLGLLPLFWLPLAFLLVFLCRRLGLLLLPFRLGLLLLFRGSGILIVLLLQSVCGPGDSENKQQSSCTDKSSWFH